MANKQAKERWARDSALARNWTSEIQRLFGEKFYGSVDSLNAWPFSVMQYKAMHIQVGSGRTEDEAIANTKKYLKEYEPQELWPYMEDEINAEPDIEVTFKPKYSGKKISKPGLRKPISEKEIQMNFYRDQVRELGLDILKLKTGARIPKCSKIELITLKQIVRLEYKKRLEKLENE